MRRSPWGMVLVSVIVMVAAAAATYVPWSRVAPPAVQAVEAAWSRGDLAARAWNAVRGPEWALDLAGARLPQLTAAQTGAAGAACLALLIAAFATVAARSRRVRPRVLRMARRGAPVSAIARQFGMSQDAVRLLTSPMIDPSRSGASGARGGNGFRFGAAASAGRDGHRDGGSRPTR